MQGHQPNGGRHAEKACPVLRHWEREVIKKAMETRRAAYLVSATVLRVCECLAGVWRAYSADVRENSDITPLT